jgi:hypothetical protein
MQVEFKHGTTQAPVLGILAIKGRQIAITSDSPECWRRFVNSDEMRSTLDQSSVVSNIRKTLNRIQSFDVVRQFDELEAKVKAITSRRWREVHHCDWRLDAALFFSGMAAKELGIDPPLSVKFFREASYGEPASFATECELRGMRRQQTIWINEKLAGRDFIETTAHETKHLAQSAADSQEREREADLFGKRFAGRFKAIPRTAQR